jgi:hypothetical protein
MNQMSARQYRRVAQSDPTEEEESKKSRAERIEKITSKIHALLWVAAAIAIFLLNDISMLIHSDKINRFAFNLSIVSFVANVGIIIYLTVMLPLVFKVTIPWEIYCPNMIPLSTFLGLLCILSLFFAFWPIWGVLTPLYIGIMTLGVIFSAHFIPWPC